LPFARATVKDFTSDALPFASAPFEAYATLLSSISVLYDLTASASAISISV